MTTLCLTDKEVQNYDSIVRPVFGYYASNDLLEYLLDQEARGNKNVLGGFNPRHLMRSPELILENFQLFEPDPKTKALLRFSSDAIFIDATEQVITLKG